MRTTLRMALAIRGWTAKDIKKRAEANGEQLAWETIKIAMDEFPDRLSLGTLRKMAKLIPGCELDVSFSIDDSDK